MSSQAISDRVTILEKLDMFCLTRARATAFASAAALLLLAGVAGAAAQPHFPTPDEAVQALIDAAASDEPGAVTKVMGDEVATLASPDPVADAADRANFVEAALESAKVEQDEGVDDRAVLSIGPDDWPFPIPLMRDAEGWYWDVAAGREELLDRRIGRNELATIDVLRAYVDAQDEYAQEDRNGDGAREYAQRLMSSEGKRDGLYWPTTGDEPESPMGPFVADAVAEGYKPGEGDGPKPYHGYLFRLLKAQGEHAPGGAKSYLNGDRLTQGFALLAYPAEYGNSGVMTFLVNQSGIVYQKDLGDDTGKVAAAIDAYDPDKSWEPVTD
jgi:hypothetical protein